MNSYPKAADLRDVLNRNTVDLRDVLSRKAVRSAPSEPARIFSENNHYFRTNDSLVNKPTQSSNETQSRAPSASSYPYFPSLYSNLNSSQPSNPLLNSFYSNLAQPAHTITDSLGLRSASISSFSQAPSTAFSPFSSSISSSLVQPPAPMASSTSTTAKSPGRRKATQSRFQELPLFFTDLEIIHAFTVYVTNKTTIVFTLKKSQVDAIRFCQKSIFLRFCKFDPFRAVQKENLPKSVRLSINSCQVPLELKNASPNLKSPVDVTARCRAVTTRMANTFEIFLDSAMDNCKKILRAGGYGIEIVLARKLTDYDTLQALTTSDAHTRSYEQTLKLIKEKCAGIDEIECEALKVPLTCAVTKKVIQLPLVGLKCRHVNCFDGATFLEMHQNKQEYVCVICHNLIRRSELVRDPWIERILQTTSRKVEQIEFDSFGHYKVSQPEKCAPRQRLKRIECITLDDEDEDENGANGANGAGSLKMIIRNPMKRPKLEVLGALNLASTSASTTTTSGEPTISQANSPPAAQNGSTADPSNQTFSSGTSAELTLNASNASAINDAIDLTESDSVIVLDSDTEISDRQLDSDHTEISDQELDSSQASDGADDSPRYSLVQNRRRGGQESSLLSDELLLNDDTEISENDNTFNDSDSQGSSTVDETAEDTDPDSYSDMENFLNSSRRSGRRTGFLSSSDDETNLSDEADDEDDEESVSDLSSNSSLSSLSSSSRDSRAREPAASGATFTPLLSRGSLNKRRRRARRFD